MTQDLQNEYGRTIAEKNEELKLLLRSVERTRSLEDLRALRIAVRKLSGHAGSYGYSKADLICKEMELDLARALEEEEAIRKPDLQLWNYCLMQIERGFLRE